MGIVDNVAQMFFYGYLFYAEPPIVTSEYLSLAKWLFAIIIFSGFTALFNGPLGAIGSLVMLFVSYFSWKAPQNYTGSWGWIIAIVGILLLLIKLLAFTFYLSNSRKQSKIPSTPEQCNMIGGVWQDNVCVPKEEKMPLF